MKNRSLLLVILMMFSAALFAGNVDKNTARKAAENQFSINGLNNTIIAEFSVASASGTAFYAFNFSDGGFAIISAEDSYFPVIGYSDKGEWNESTQPSHYRGLMQDYKDQIDFLRQNNSEASPEIVMAWDNLLNGRSIKNGSKGVEPLLVSSWNQDDPYNYLCPVSAAGPGGHVYAGCVATAMAQIMYYWRWPLQGTGQYSYYQPPYGTISANFGNTNYNWNGMVGSTPNALNIPVAEIQYHCGVAVRMNYGPDGSGAYSIDVPAAVKNYFKYSTTTQYLSRSSYSATAWETMVKEQCDMGNPVYYSGSNAEGGHAFIVDGYNDATPVLYHFDFGWDGYSNGYYSLANAGGFTMTQGMVRNFVPGTGYPYYATGTTVITDWVGSLGDGSGPVAEYQANTNAKWIFDPQTTTDSVTSITLNFKKFEMGSGDYIRIYDGEDENAPLIGEYTGTNMPAAITSTGNKLMIHMVTDASGNGQGFYLEFTTTRPTYCSGTLTLTDVNGSFGDGSLGFHYNNNTNCNYKILPQWSTETTLHFDSFETEATNDWLKIYDFASLTLIAELSGSYTTMPGPFVSPSGQFYMIWKTNGSVNGPGWTCHYETMNVGVETRELISNFHLYPNPASDKLNIGFDVNTMQDVQIRMTSANGKTVYTKNENNFNGRFSSQIDVSNLAKGIYLLTISGDKGIYNRKVVIN